MLPVSDPRADRGRSRPFLPALQSHRFPSVYVLVFPDFRPSLKGLAMSQDRLSYDTDISSAVQGAIQSVVGHLESLIGAHEKSVNSAMSDFQADGVSEEYRAVENRFRNAAHETRNIIALVKQTLNLNDQTAFSAGARAKGAVQNIG